MRATRLRAVRTPVRLGHLGEDSPGCGETIARRALPTLPNELDGHHQVLVNSRMRRQSFAVLRRRSQNARLSWERFIRITDRFFPPVKVLHPLPCHRFDAKTQGRSPVR